MNADSLQDWVGRTQTSRDVVSPVQARQMAAALDDRGRMIEPALGPLPAGWHWLYFNPLETQSLLSPDGHPPRGDFLPPVELPRRMWAGGRLHWTRALQIGSTLDRCSTVLKVECKSGHSGEMVFVTVQHRFSDDQGELLSEEHDIVYREGASAADRAAMASLGKRIKAGEHAFEREGEQVREVTADAVMLFRYSAATFNGHRIHYDADYARHVEHYPGLIVHGPLIATLLLDLVQHELATDRAISRFEFRLMRPTFDLAPFHLHATATDDGFQLWSSDNIGRVALTGRVVLGD